VTSAAGYSGTPLPAKLGVKPGQVVLLDRLPAELSLDLPGAHVVRRLRAGLDVTLTFHTSLSTLSARLPAVFSRTVTDWLGFVSVLPGIRRDSHGHLSWNFTDWTVRRSNLEQTEDLRIFRRPARQHIRYEFFSFPFVGKGRFGSDGLDCYQQR